MSGELQPDEIRARRFSTARRGYDRDEVDAFAQQVADAYASLQLEMDALEQRVEALGGGGPEARAELDAVGDDVARILEAAREAAENMRARASEDAARWRADADREADERKRSAQSDAETVRGEAWETGTELLEHAKSRSEELERGAEQDALFIRAEAEREALRLTGDARRDGEEALRTARAEAEQMLARARAESESSRAAAQEAVDAAQERARALELRRAELLDELEAARASIGGLTSQEADDSTIRVVPATEAPGEDGGTWNREWVDEDSTVRLLDPSTLPVMAPVDADELVAEVEQLRRSDAAVAVQDENEEAQIVVALDDAESAEGDLDTGAEIHEPEDAAEVAADTGAVAVAEATESDTGESERTAAQPEAAERDDVESERAEPAAAEPDEAVPERAQAESEAAEPAAAEPDQPPDAAPMDGIDRLFASLRTTNGRTPEAVVPLAPEPEPVGTEVSPQVEPERVAAVASVAMVGDPFELRDKLLLPIENRALRTVKRRLVDLQNRVLEELRVSDDSWEPDRAMIAASFADELKQLAREALVAGYSGGADLIGASMTPQPKGGDPADPTEHFVGGLVDAIGDALRGARAAGSGARQVAAAVSRVFRGWRTDEAERRVRMAAFAAYHEGVARSFDAMGVPHVRGEARRKACPQCAPGLDKPWGPGEPAELPPLHVDCDCTLVPA